MKKIKVGIVNYLNTQPMLLGLEQNEIKHKIELTGDYPANIAEQLKRGDIDLGLIPVAEIAKLPTYYLVGSHCISTKKVAASVCLFSEVPMEKIEKVLVDYQSRTSAMLIRLLMKKHWKREVEWVSAQGENFIDEIKDTQAGLIIGDRALRARSRFPYVYDLGEGWNALTGLPFVFAAWVSTRPLPENFVAEFDAANALGMTRIEEVVAKAPYSVGYDLLYYYTKNMEYNLTPQKEEAIRLFLKEISAY